jgi:BirA family transcriptional regulator, biotin operon repressor / biotin---[acetyl-CoA-carboxylase] ligase
VKLSDAAISAGFSLELHQSLGSTNDEAMALARRGGPGKCWIVAREQGAGRGRHGRNWASPPGNLYASLLLIDPCAAAKAPQLGFVAAVALHEAVRQIAGSSAGALALKWPNDLVADGAKLAGILIEGTTLSPAGPLAAVIGIGVNVVNHPGDTPYPATDLAALGLAADTGEVFAAVSATMVRQLAVWEGGDGFAAIRAGWLARAGGLGARIVVRRPGGDRQGLFVDLDPEGRLLLKEPGGVVAIEAGDVFPVGPIERSA